MNTNETKDMFRFQLADLFLYVIKGGLKGEYMAITDSPYDGLSFYGIQEKEVIESQYKIKLPDETMWVDEESN